MTRYYGIGRSMVLCASLAPCLALPAFAEQTTKSCYAEYVANKAKIEARGFTEKDFLADCLLRPAGATATPVAAAAVSAAPAASTSAAVSAAPAASTSAAVSAAPSPAVVPPRRPAVDPAATILAIVAPKSASSAVPLGRFAKKEACLASARAIRLNLKQATDAAKIDCLTAAAFEAARTAQ